MTYCSNCNSKMFNGACTWCHEEVYIRDQYIELDMEVPELISNKCKEFEPEIKRNQINKGGGDE